MRLGSDGVVATGWSAGIHGGMAHRGSSETQHDLLADLTPQQAAAVSHGEGPLLVLAGAGAGKTRVVTRRAAYLAVTIAQPYEILVLTFTNKAAHELRERVERLGEAMTVCTFHSLCAKLLRVYGERGGIAADFTIFDSADQRRVIQQAVLDAGLQPAHWPPPRVQAVISRAKNAMITADKFADNARDWATQKIARVYAAYEDVLAAQHGLDFDDLLLKLVLLMRTDESLRSAIERRFRYVLIDEYQDTNLAQYEMLRLMTCGHGNVCATGDPDQSIYGWRGADVRNILRFEQDHPGAVVVKLERNYRSSKRILSAASRLIACNVHRKDKALWTENDQGVPVRVVDCPDAGAEARFVADEVAGRIGRGGRADEVAVCYRINALSRAVEEELIRRGIRYQVARGTEFYGRKEVKDVLAYARVLINRCDDTALTRIINTPARGIGGTTVARLQHAAGARGCPLVDVVRRADSVEALGAAAVKRVNRFAELLDQMAPLVQGRPRDSLARLISESGLRAELAAVAEHDPQPLANVDELVNAAAAFEKDHPDATLLDWLQHTSLLGDVDTIETSAGAVTLMTLHAAKGLEFDAVYVLGLEDGMLPFRRDPAERDEDVEEERRLLFVGMTRARHELTLTYSRYRMMRGMSERKVRSPFIIELPASEVQWVSTDRQPGESTGTRGGGRLPPDIEQWGPGTLVRHPKHDLGQIVWMRRNGRQMTVGVRFRDQTERTFILGFEQLERVDFDEVGDV